jgi:hypothetical protein
MRLKWLHMVVLLAIAGVLPGQQPKSQSKPGSTASGVFVGRSGTPMTGARLILCSVHENRDSFRGVLRLLADVPTATADKTGRFEFRGFAPGRFCIIYLPSGVQAVMPNEIAINTLEGIDKSIAPLLRNYELGKSKPYGERPWAEFTLLKGHTLWSMGDTMKLWNASVRRGKQGPFLEVRRGVVVLTELADKSEIKFDAWSF